VLDPVFDLAAWRAVFAACPAFLAACAAVFGALNLSFGGLVVDRLPHILGWREDPIPGLGLSGPPSRCDACGGRIGPLALIPVVGWLVHRGRCASCGGAVPWKYPAMEALGGTLSAAFALKFGFSAETLWAVLLVPAAMVLAWIDWNEQWIPDRIALPLLLAGLAASPFAPGPQMRIDGLILGVSMMWAAQAVGGRSRGVDAMMGGDVVAAAIAGAWLGLGAVPAWAAATFAFYLTYAVPARRSGEMWAPFGPAMFASMLVCLWFLDAVSFTF
jgi:prepilin signal peptidase PulO-like enzyme (type II secretory pathway)